VNSQIFMLFGVAVLIPLILAYTAWAYWVFRGKVRAGGGGHLSMLDLAPHRPDGAAHKT
jgi:hypothetical protein